MHSSGSGYGYGYGDGSGYGYGDGSGYGYGDGYGNGCGYGDSDEIGSVAGYRVAIVWPGVVKVGCEIHTVAAWRSDWRQIARRRGVDVCSDEAERLLAAATKAAKGETAVIKKISGDYPTAPEAFRAAEALMGEQRKD